MPMTNCRTDTDAEGNFNTIYSEAWIADAINGTLPLWRGSKKLIVRECTAGLHLQSFEVTVPPGATQFGFVEGPLLGFYDDREILIGVLHPKYEV